MLRVRYRACLVQQPPNLELYEAFAREERENDPSLQADNDPCCLLKNKEFQNSMTVFKKTLKYE